MIPNAVLLNELDRYWKQSIVERLTQEVLSSGWGQAQGQVAAIHYAIKASVLLTDHDAESIQAIGLTFGVR